MAYSVLSQTTQQHQATQAQQVIDNLIKPVLLHKDTIQGIVTLVPGTGTNQIENILTELIANLLTDYWMFMLDSMNIDTVDVPSELRDVCRYIGESISSHYHGTNSMSDDIELWCLDQFTEALLGISRGIVKASAKNTIDLMFTNENIKSMRLGIKLSATNARKIAYNVVDTWGEAINVQDIMEIDGFSGKGDLPKSIKLLLNDIAEALANLVNKDTKSLYPTLEGVMRGVIRKQTQAQKTGEWILQNENPFTKFMGTSEHDSLVKLFTKNPLNF